MLRTTGIVSHRRFTGEGTWLDRYCTVASRNRFPTSYHLLCGIFTLTSIIGRRCRLKLPDISLYPPISIILIGTSGVGKSRSMDSALAILNAVAAKNEFPFFVADELTGTPSGLINRWVKWQHDGEPGEGVPLEGVYTCDEMGAFVAPITGNDNSDKFLIKVLKHDKVENTTASKGVRFIRDVTIAFGFCTTIDDLREKMSARSFADGLMHRFLIAFEKERPNTDAMDTTPSEVNDLAEEAIALRDDAPDTMEIPHATWEYVKALKNLTEERTYPVAALHGFWNRYPGFAAKLGAARAISEGRWELTVEDVQTGVELLDNFMYPPLEELVRELAAPPKMRTLYAMADDLESAGKDGITDTDMRLRTGSVSVRAQGEFLGVLQTCNLGYKHLDNRWYRFKELAPQAPAPIEDEIAYSDD